MKKLVFAGCSFTAGVGWVDDIPERSRQSMDPKSPYLWTNLCHGNIDRLSNLDSINLGKSGASNTDIFQNVVRVLGDKNRDIDVMFVQWTAMPRYNFNIGFELWDTEENFDTTAAGSNKYDIRLSNGDSWPRDYVVDLVDRLKVLHHLHWEILKVVDYSNTISNLAKILGIEVFFINGLCPWDKDYFLELTNVKPEAYTDFTKKIILEIDHRNDEDIYKLYSMAHQHYQQAGGIKNSQWINLYDSFLNHKIDVNFDQWHPGKVSNETYADMIYNRLKELSFI